MPNNYKWTTRVRCTYPEGVGLPFETFGTHIASELIERCPIFEITNNAPEFFITLGESGDDAQLARAFSEQNVRAALSKMSAEFISVECVEIYPNSAIDEHIEEMLPRVPADNAKIIPFPNIKND